jgi:hypothetical protein
MRQQQNETKQTWVYDLDIGVPRPCHNCTQVVRGWLLRGGSSLNKSVTDTDKTDKRRVKAEKKDTIYDEQKA